VIFTVAELDPEILLAVTKYGVDAIVEVGVPEIEPSAVEKVNPETSDGDIVHGFDGAPPVLMGRITGIAELIGKL
jgi:hypothetical protein